MAPTASSPMDMPHTRAMQETHLKAVEVGALPDNLLLRRMAASCWWPMKVNPMLTLDPE